jgi:hypothetical protein
MAVLAGAPMVKDRPDRQTEDFTNLFGLKSQMEPLLMIMVRLPILAPSA